VAGGAGRHPDLRRPAHEVAPALLGCRLQVQAYDQDDPASHTHRGPTPGNATMFGPAGRIYTYFTYGMHWCANVVTGAEGEGQAVLLRAAELVRGSDAIRARRGDRVPDRDLLRGPARLAQALGLGAAADGVDVLAPGAPVRLRSGRGPAPAITRGPRVGVRLAADVPWRWWITDHPGVSSYRRHPRAAPPGDQAG
jgi:DNA-3-methyladenine glycosylase